MRFVLLFGVLLPSLALADVMSSTNYRIIADSVNSGGLLGSSTSYNIEDTLGEIATGDSQSSSYKLLAGYQAMKLNVISISSPSNVALGTLPTSGGGTGNGSAVWTVATDNLAGYALSIRATSSPALTSGSNSFADYTPVSSIPDYTFSVGSTDSEFGFSPEGVHIVSRFKDDGSACNTGSGDTADRCFDAFSTNDQTVAQYAFANWPNGTATTVKFRAEIGSAKIQQPGTYTATIIATAIPL